MSITQEPRPEITVDDFPRPKRAGWMDIVTSADHKQVAKILMVGSGGFLFLAALELLLMRLQLAIPENTFTKPPSAELRPDQKDTDSLPPYEVLDQILRLYIENNDAPQHIADALHLPVTLVRDIVNKVDRNEYKRQQAAPGLKVTTKAFGIGRRFPIAQRFSE